MVKRFALLFVLLVALLTPGVLAQSTDECMACHSDPDLTTSTPEGERLSLHVDLEVYENSIHGVFDCIDCHATIEDLPHDEVLPRVDCGECHSDAVEEYQDSIHAIGWYEGISLSAGCADCHGKHDVQPSAEESSRTNPRNLAKMCGQCHARPEVSAIFGRRGFDPIADYEESVHGKKLRESPDAEVATCVRCHGSHTILPPVNPESSFCKFEVPNTCGGCHEKESEEYKQSVHWTAVNRGHFESPVCNDCHAEHRIISPTTEDAMTHPSLVSSELCASCHANKILMTRFGLDAERFSSYMKTYHGLAVLRGSPDAANCVSCHEVHAIRSATDEESATHPNHVGETCGQCHAESNGTFAQVAVHPLHQKERNPAAYFIRIAYLWLIFLTIGGMLVHNLIIHSYFIRKKWREVKYQEHVRRFQRFEVFQHMALFLSFFILVVTGFALKFPDAEWVKLTSYVGMSETVRSLVHRIAAVVLVAASLVQLGYLVLHRGGRRDSLSLFPSIDDVKQMWDSLRFHLFLSKDHPRFGRFDYTEKAEYLALIWGTVIMAATGFILWFPEFFLGFLPVWIFEVSEVIHYYEAWLATLAIIVWHWYFVIFHPERYPLSFTWLTGTITRDEQEHHHPQEVPETTEESPEGSQS